jgi:hypothetical protein
MTTNTLPAQFSTRPLDTPEHLRGVRHLWTTGDASHELRISPVWVHEQVARGNLQPVARTTKRQADGRLRQSLLFDPEDVRELARRRSGQSAGPVQLELEGAKALRRVLPFEGDR